MDFCVLLYIVYTIVLTILVNYMWLKKIHESWTSPLIFPEGPIGTSWTSQENFGFWGPHTPYGTWDPQISHFFQLEKLDI